MRGDLSKQSLKDMKNKDVNETYDQSTDSLEALREAVDAGMVVLQANTRALIVFPSEVEIPEAATTTYRLYLYIFDTEGEMEAPDSAPTITIINSAGGVEVSEIAMTNVDTGRYYYPVVISNTETPANWIAQIKVIEGGDTRYYGSGFDLVHDSVGARNDTTTDTIHGKLGTDTELSDRSIADVLFLDGPPGTFPAAVAPGDDVSFAEILRYIVENQLGTSFDGSPDLYTQLGAFDTYTTINKVSLAAWLGLPDTASYHSFYEYLVTGANTSANPDISENADGSLLERLEAVQVDVTGLNGAAMRGTDSAALASVLGALTDAAAQDADSNAFTTMQHIKGLHDVLWDDAGIAAYPVAAAPANGVSIAEVLRSVYDDTNELQADWANAGRLDTILDTIAADVVDTKEGKTQILEVSVTSAANAGVTTVATITTQPCLIEGVVVHADAGQTADMTSCAVEGGGSQVVEFIGTDVAIQANLDTADDQVSWTGLVRLAATKTITIDLQGTGATGTDLTVVIMYRACVDGGYLT